MTDLDSLPFAPADSAPNLGAAPARRCLHPKAYRGSLIVDGIAIAACGRCGHQFDPDRQRAGRNARLRGKRTERTEMRRAGIHTGNANKADDGQSADGMFSYQAKAFASSRFPSWMTLELDKLRVAHASKVPVLMVAESAGRGVRGRRIAIVEWSDWLDLHGRHEEGTNG